MHRRLWGLCQGEEEMVGCVGSVGRSASVTESRRVKLVTRKEHGSGLGPLK